MNDRMRMPLVLVPGLLCDATLWAPQREALSDFADIWIADVSQAATLPDAVLQLLREAPFERFALAGLSMGGYLAALAALRAPRRIERLALLNTRAHAQENSAGRERRNALMALARRDFPAAVEQLLPTLLRPQALRDPALAETVRRMSLAQGAATFIRQQLANMERPAIADELARIACPTWILGADQDAIAPPASQFELARAIPGAVLHMLSDCGHLSTLEQPGAVNRLLRRWLDGAPLSPCHPEKHQGETP